MPVISSKSRSLTQDEYSSAWEVDPPPEREIDPPPPPERETFDEPPEREVDPPPPEREEPPPERGDPLRRELPRTDLPRDEIIPDEPTTRQGRPPEDTPADDSLERPPVATPRPPGTYPRAIAHNEQVEYSYDPETDEFHARIVDSSEPVVTRWDDSPPEQTERPVGTFDVTPTEGGVQAEETGRAVVLEGVKAELKRQAEETGERASSTALLKYQHDLDSGETDYRAPRRSPAELAAIIQRRNEQRDNGAPSELSAKYQMAAKHLERQAQEQKAAQRQQRASRRRSGSAARDKEPGYSLPQIVITSEPMGGGRMGGL